ncbi:hypothetical protein glysoja_018592 [Glycine soja]|nr:hypothetical protein glysoja_018592 [Glycine soja]
MLMSKQKKSQIQNAKRLLISINVLGSAGPIRFVVNEEELVAAVIDTARGGFPSWETTPPVSRFTAPILDPMLRSPETYNSFSTFWVNLYGVALSPWDRIGSHGVRNFMLCKKPEGVADADGDASGISRSSRGIGSWKAWFNKSLNLKISTH